MTDRQYRWEMAKLVATSLLMISVSVFQMRQYRIPKAVQNADKGNAWKVQ